MFNKSISALRILQEANVSSTNDFDKFFSCLYYSNFTAVPSSFSGLASEEFGRLRQSSKVRICQFRPHLEPLGLQNPLNQIFDSLGSVTFAIFRHFMLAKLIFADNKIQILQKVKMSKQTEVPNL